MKSACRFRLFAATAAFGAALAVATPGAAWGPIGHRVSGEIAERNISGHARAHIMLILGDEALPEASTSPDEERSNPAPFWQETASPWHYVTLPEGLTSDQLEHPPEGDAATALEQFTAIGEAAGEGAGDATREAPLALSWQYTYDWTPAMEQRLQQAGIRVAAYLDWVFAEVAAP